METTATPAAIHLARKERAVAVVEIEGTAPLITHRWSEKARHMMLEAQQSKTRAKKPAKDPQAEYESSMYFLPDGRHGFPAAGFKAAIVGAVRLFEGLTMVTAKQSLFVIGEGPEQLIELICEEGPTMREDPVRVGMGTADLRYRAQFEKWGARIPVQFLPEEISVESIMALVDAAGLGGVGEWRPSAPKSSTGSYGTFGVVALNVLGDGVERSS